MAITVLFAGIPVSDYPASRDWYERLLGRAPDMLPHDHEAAWHLADAGWIYVVGDSGRAGTALLTLIVDDLDQHIAALQGRGLDGGPVETQPGAYRRVAMNDPDGNRITFAEVPTPNG